MDYPNSLKDKKILITCGPTWTAIDSVRVVSNISTGELGHRISHLLCREKAKVTLVQGPGTYALRHKPFKVIPFCFFNELHEILKKELQKKTYDAVIHAAAVSDYQVAKPLKKKIASNRQSLRIDLVPTKKIIQDIKRLDPNVFLVGFKLESELNKDFLVRQAAALIAKANCDLVIANFSRSAYYKAYLIDRNKKILAYEASREKIAKQLVAALKERL